MSACAPRKLAEVFSGPSNFSCASELQSDVMVDSLGGEDESSMPRARSLSTPVAVGGRSVGRCKRGLSSALSGLLYVVGFRGRGARKGEKGLLL